MLEVEPELDADRARPQDRDPLSSSPATHAISIAITVVDEELSVLVPDVVDEDRGRPVVRIETETQVTRLVRLLRLGRVAGHDGLDALE